MSVRTVLRALVVAVLLAAIVGGLGKVRTDTTQASFVPPDDPAQRATLAAARSFGGDPVVVLAESAEPGTLLEGDQLLRLAHLEGTLSQLPDVSVVYGPGTVLNQVAAQARNLLATISGRRDALKLQAEQSALAADATKAEARQAADRAVAGFDARYGSLLVRGLPAGLPTLRNPAFVRAVVFDEDGNPRQQWRFVVPRPDAVAVIVRPREGLDQAATQRLVDAVEGALDDSGLDAQDVTVTGMPVVAAGLGDVLEREMPLIGGLALAMIALCYLLLPWLRPRRRRLIPLVTTSLATAATLALFGWLDRPVSLGAVAFLPILLGTGSDFPAYLVRGADRRVVVVTGLAAAAGFATLAISPVPLVQDLGLALACGVVLTLGIGLVAVGRRRDEQPGEPAESAPPVARGMGFGARAGLLTVAVAAAAIGWIALPQLEIEAEPDRLAAGAPVMTDANHAEEVLGSAGEVQLLVRGDDVLTPSSLTWMTQVQDVVLRKYGDRMHPIASPPSLLAFLGPRPTEAQLQAGLAQLPPYLRAAVVRDDHREAVLSFGVELDDVAEQRDLIDDLVRDVPPAPDGLTLETAGLPVVAGRSYSLLSEHRYLHGAIGIAVAGLVLAIGLRRRKDALLAVAAASVATGWGFLLAWVVGMSLTPLTLALGSLAAATACEFTVLLGAVRGRHLRRSVLAAALAATSGYAVLGASDLAVIRSFGAFLAVTVLLSLLAAHVVRLVAHGRTAAAAPQTHSTVGTTSPSATKSEVLV